MHQDDSGSLWRAYGLRANPFFQDELEPDPQAEHPVSLFIGREEELKALRRGLEGELHSRTVIEGAVGVGKTTLVNRFKVEKAGRLLSQDDAVPVVAGMEPNNLLAEVLRALLRMRAELHGQATLFRAGRGRASKPRQGGGRFWKDAARIVNGMTVLSPSVQGGVNFIASAGVGFARGHLPAEAPLGSLHPVVAEALERLSAESGRDVLLHLNNLENLGLRDARQAAELFLNIRASLILPRTHWIFVGADGIDRQVFRAYDQISGFVPDPIVLAPLAPDEVAAMLGVRYRYLKRGRQYTAPVEPQDAADLYRIFHGDLRTFLRVMSDACKRFLGTAGVQPLRTREVMTYMAPVCAARLEHLLGDTHFQHLAATVRGLKKTAEFRVTDVKDALKLTQAAASQIVQQWTQRKAVLLARTEGRNRYFTLSGEAAIAFHAP
jgi:hypothetical protein